MKKCVVLLTVLSLAASAQATLLTFDYGNPTTVVWPYAGNLDQTYGDNVSGSPDGNGESYGSADRYFLLSGSLRHSIRDRTIPLPFCQKAIVTSSLIEEVNVAGISTQSPPSNSRHQPIWLSKTRPAPVTVPSAPLPEESTTTDPLVSSN